MFIGESLKLSNSSYSLYLSRVTNNSPHIFLNLLGFPQNVKFAGKLCVAAAGAN